MSSKGITTFLQELQDKVLDAGGGGGGTIREAGGSFGKREAALEEQYMREQQKEALDGMKNKIKMKQIRNLMIPQKWILPKMLEKTSTTSHPSPSGEGAVRSSGGSFVKRKSALEDQYIKNQEKTKK
ncbi:ATPIF1 [Lepeophtheirus salmonis]|uniref:ATPIF1 n=1 Tax=Lepeophtheirus salmonis TaxID=72036 RepID=A0A7R8CZJ8_LEPSM|nr:ATPIF1 [Lepeophtheirus salmonis]CAF2951004.1 ATPIF1 [Lepeophtheirus salmonis]